jgi:hypothetical protein
MGDEGNEFALLYVDADDVVGIYGDKLLESSTHLAPRLLSVGGASKP